MKTASKKTSKASKKEPERIPVKLPDPAEQEQLNNVKLFANLVKELLERGSANIISAKSRKPNKFVKMAVTYIKLLGSVNCKLSMHHELFREMYAEHRNRILKCRNNEGWMNKLDSSINIHLGKGTSYEKDNIVLKISIACSNALRMREEIDNAKYDNVNDKEEATGRYEYLYVALFYFRLLTVIKDALGESHSDSPVLSKIIEYYYARSGLMEESSSSEDSKGEGISKFVNELGGGKTNMDSKGVQKAIEKVTSNTEMIGTITTAMKEFTSPDNKNKDQGEIFADMARKVGPSFANLFDGINNDKKKEEESSGDDDTDSSEESE